MPIEILRRIDQALAHLPGIKSGASAYAALLREYRKRGGDPNALAKLREGLVDVVAGSYRATSRRDCELLEFNDGAFDFLFDATLERTVLVHGITKGAPPNSRDNSYHKGYPARPGYDKGHAMAHAQGGREGGPNYFPQRAALNRRLSAHGNLWRDIETHLAANQGLFAFVRLVYLRGNDRDEPDKVEYGLLNPPGQFRAVIFPNG